MRKNLQFNAFNSNVSFDNPSFGLLTFFASSHRDPFNSHILNQALSFDLVKLCSFSLDDKWHLLYRGSVHGFGASEFHARCDGVPNTFSIMQPKDSPNIFGCFTALAWDSSCKWTQDSEAFIFSLVNGDAHPLTMKAMPEQYSFYSHLDYGPILGVGHDIFVCSNADEKRESFSNLGGIYKHPRYVEGSKEAKEFLAGSHYFQLSEIEVYHRE